jgi:hypothetical protein
MVGSRENPAFSQKEAAAAIRMDVKTLQARCRAMSTAFVDKV